MITPLLLALAIDWDLPTTGKFSIEKEKGAEVIHMLEPGPKNPVPRRPQTFVLARTKPFRKVTIECEVKRHGKSLIIVYAYQDEAHFNYAHLSSDTAKQVAVHNGMFHVYGNERVRMSNTEGPASLPSAEWTKVRFTHDGSSGRAWVEVDGQKFPSLVAVDLSLTEGRVGFGSFNETASFRNIRITGE